MDASKFTSAHHPIPKKTPIALKDSALPARPRAVLEGVFAYLSGELEKSLRHTLNEYEQALFRLAEQSRSNEEQQRAFESLRETRRARADVTPHFLLNLEAALAACVDPEGRAAPVFSKSPSSGRDSSLSLVDNTAFEESLALLEAANRAEIKLGQKLFGLGQRFAVLIALPAFEPDELPIGPQRLCECLRLAIEGFELPAEHRQLLFKVFDRHVMQEIESSYDGVTKYLIESRILPNLVVSAPRLRRSGAAGGSNPKAAEAQVEEAKPTSNEAATQTPAKRSQPSGAADSSGTPAAGSAPSAPNYHAVTAMAPTFGAQSNTQRPLNDGLSRRPGSPNAAAIEANSGPAQSFGMGSMPSASASGGDDELLVGGFGRPLTTGWPGAPQTLPRETAVNDPQDRQMFSTLRELLAGRRAALGMNAATPAGDVHPIQSSDVQSVLGLLQNAPTAPLTVAGKVVPRNVTHIKQDLLNQLRQLTPEGKLPKLAEEDTDTIDLVGMLFDNLTKEGRSVAPVQELLSKLQVPVMRVALRDKGFFSQRSHPARQLLNALAEGSFYYMGEPDQDKGLVEKMQMVVDRVNNEYEDDLAVFESLLSDFAKHLHTLVRKSEVSERRHVESAKGREKLEQARKTAAAAIADRLQGKKPRALIRTLLEQAWADVLALTILRSGENSDAYQRRLAIIDRLLDSDIGRDQTSDTTPSAAADTAATASTAPDSTPEPAIEATIELPELRSEVESGLAQVGFHLDDVQSVIGRLFDAEKAAQNDDTATLTEVAARLRAKTRFGEEAGDHKERAVMMRAEPSLPLTPQEMAVVARLKTLPFGTWFEMQIASGDWQPRKLSWFSPLSGRCLFVNQRGARADEMSLESLAHEIAEKRVRLLEDKRESIIDRAWSAIVRTMKNLASPEATADQKLP
ncbi:MAG: hypothetical protein COS34_14495 [Lysobacterales bacterium CG02_land_8_20_14_3_00_62_12]|nr:MAG: hypothetical protein COS34_14495 [Xanthomonadales bacterium CG02_land_8_20_14_3_00_62_12]